MFNKLIENGIVASLRCLFFRNCTLVFRSGIDPGLAQHIAHLFIRDAVILFEEKLHLDDSKDTDHFEVSFTFSQTLALSVVSLRTLIPRIGNRCVSNPHRLIVISVGASSFGRQRYPTARFSSSFVIVISLLQLQMTDFENAALVTFIVLLTRAIMTYNLNLLIPISLVRPRRRRNMSILRV